MRSTIVLTAFVLALPLSAFGQTPTPTPVASPTPEAEATDDLPTVTDDDDGLIREDDDSAWGDRSRGGGMLAGVRAGFHSFEPSGFSDGGLAFEVTGAMPVFSSFYAAIAVGYHTGFRTAGHDDPDPKKRFFDAQWGALEGQYRKNVGPINLIGGVGLGVLTANSAEVTLADGSPSTTSGTGGTAHLVGGAFYPIMGRMGVVAQVKYAFAPIAFEETEETLGMGGITLAAGIDIAF